MALTSNDETDLLLPLFAGMHEQPGFATFLHRLQRRTRAERVALLVRGGAGAGPAEWFAGRALAVAEIPPGHERLRPGRVYAAAEIGGAEPGAPAAAGLIDERIVRIPGDAAAWLTLARAEPCGAADSALLSALVPYLAAALRGRIEAQQQRAAAAIGSAALARAGAGWIALDRDGRVLASDPDCTARLAAAGVRIRPGERPQLPEPGAERLLAQGTARLAADPAAAPCALVLAQHPRIEAVLRPGSGEAAALLLCRFPSADSPSRPALFAQLTGLPPREAELAVALCGGASIAEAAAAMGLTLETARNYSKRVFARLGVRGQAELVRRFYLSGAALG